MLICYASNHSLPTRFVIGVIVIKKLSIKPRKTPLQDRARFTVNTILESAAHILREEGYIQLNTNYVAAKAGISIGSLYQYFPNKEAIIAELHRQHFEKARDEMNKAYQQIEGLPFEAASRLLLESTIKVHQIDPELHRIISTQAPNLNLNEDDNSAHSVRKMLEQFFYANKDSLRPNLDIPLAAHISYQLVISVTHAAVNTEPELLKHPKFVDELLRMLLAYVQ